jgi:hypothetical protein
MRKKTHGALPEFNEWMLIGKAMAKIQFWSGKYDLSFQFWGEGDCNVYISKDSVDIKSMGGEDTPLEIMNQAIEWCEKANPSTKYPEGIEASNPQP